jgi:hypothetical protein
LGVAAGAAFIWSDPLLDWYAGRSPAEEEALAALVALRSITQAGAGYPEYAARVNEVQARVLGALSEENGSEARHPLQMAMNYYVAAALAWQASQGPREAGWIALAARLPRDADFSMCPAIRFVFAQADKQRRGEDTFAIDALNIAPFWVCADDQVSRAQRLLPSIKR